MDENENKPIIKPEHLEPDNLVRYAFLWSEARMAIAAVALLIGGYPPVFKLLGSGSLVSLGLTLSWIISGVASAYLLWRWYTGGMKLFTNEKQYDKWAFLLSGITGINLGLAGLLSTNILMNITMVFGPLMQLIFIAAAVIYVATLVYLWKRWKESGEKLFPGQSEPESEQKREESREGEVDKEEQGSDEPEEDEEEKED